MIHVTYDRQHNRLIAKGHAGSGPRGKDLVCAAVSALVLTLGADVADLAADEKVRRHVLRLEPGDSFISCIPNAKMGPVVKLIFDSVCSGFELLETLYPQYIQYHVV